MLKTNFEYLYKLKLQNMMNNKNNEKKQKTNNITHQPVTLSMIKEKLKKNKTTQNKENAQKINNSNKNDNENNKKDNENNSTSPVNNEKTKNFNNNNNFDKKEIKFIFRSNKIKFELKNQSTSKLICYVKKDLKEKINNIHSDIGSILLIHSPPNEIMGLKKNKVFNAYYMVLILERINILRIRVYLKYKEKLTMKENIFLNNKLEREQWLSDNDYSNLTTTSLEYIDQIMNLTKAYQEDFKKEFDLIKKELDKFIFKEGEKISEEFYKLNMRILQTFVLFYRLKGYGPKQSKIKQNLPLCIREALEEDFKRVNSNHSDDDFKIKIFKVRTEEDFAKLLSNINLEEMDLSPLLDYPLDQITVTKKKKILRNLPCCRLLRLYNLIYMCCLNLPRVMLSKIDRSFLNFSLLSCYCNCYLYDMTLPPDHPDYKKIEKFQKKLATLIAICLGNGDYDNFITNVESISKLDLYNKTVKELKKIPEHDGHHFINPETGDLWKEKDPIITHEEFTQWIRNYVYTENYTIPYYNLFNRGKYLDGNILIHGIGLDTEGLNYNYKYAHWEGLKKENIKKYEKDIVKAKETHHMVEINQQHLKKLINKLFIIHLESEELYNKYNKKLDFPLERDIELSFNDDTY